MFADKFRSLYQSAPTSDLEMDSLIGMINARMASMHESNTLDCVIIYYVLNMYLMSFAN